MDELTQSMKDAGCDKETIGTVCRLYDGGQVEDAVKVLRRHRCALMDEVHESQSKVDCLDFLLRNIEKGRAYKISGR